MAFSADQKGLDLLVKRLMLVVLLSGILRAAMAVSICNIDSAKLDLCLPAVSGKAPLPPTKKCCTVVQHANLPCLCNYKLVLPAFGINPGDALALPQKCGLKAPPECRML